MIISKKKLPIIHPDLTFQNQTIDRVKSHKHLGLVLSSDLTWTEHINLISAKATRLLNYMTPLKMKLDRLTLQRAYFSFIRPIIEYGDVVWDIAKTDDTTLDKLEKINANAARLVCGATARCHRANLYEENKWEYLTDRRRNHRLTVYYKMTYGLAPAFLLHILPPKVADRTSHNLRNKNDTQTPSSRINAHKYSFLPATIKDWNILPTPTKESKSINAFKHALTKRKERPPAVYYMGERYISAHHSRMRIGCSALRKDLCQELKVIPSPVCSCGHKIEDAIHYFYHCPIYTNERRVLMEKLYTIGKFTVATLLYGDPKASVETNKNFFNAVHAFMKETKRFY
jgi:hypothetical protein